MGRAGNKARDWPKLGDVYLASVANERMKTITNKKGDTTFCFFTCFFAIKYTQQTPSNGCAGQEWYHNERTPNSHEDL